MIHTLDTALPHGTRLHCRTSGQTGRPMLLFLHGFPEAAFIWDEALAITLPESMLRIGIPTLVLWGMNDPGLVERLDAWVLHEDPAWVLARPQAFLLYF